MFLATWRAMYAALRSTFVGYLRLRHFGRMLCADDDGVDPHGAVAVVLDRDLALAIGPQPIDLALLPHARQPIENPMRQRDRQRHHLRRFVAGIAEHQPLVPC